MIGEGGETSEKAGVLVQAHRLSPTMSFERDRVLLQNFVLGTERSNSNAKYKSRELKSCSLGVILSTTISCNVCVVVGLHGYDFTAGIAARLCSAKFHKCAAPFPTAGLFLHGLERPGTQLLASHHNFPKQAAGSSSRTPTVVSGAVTPSCSMWSCI